MEENVFYLYKHTNNINSKVYIGITCQEPTKRWLNGKGYVNNDYFNKSINKYGWENFSHEILFKNLTKEEAEKKEQELIAYYKSNQREFGYNIANGGMHKGKHSEETKKKLSESHKGKPAWNKNLHVGIGEENGFFGHHHTEETKKKIGEANKGRKKTKEQIEKIKESCKKTWQNKIKNGYIASEETRLKLSKANKGKTSSFKGRHHTEETKLKLKIARLGKKQSKESIEKTAIKNRKAILCYNKNMEFLKEYDSTVLAGKELNIKPSNITRALKNENATAKGYKFRYKEINNEEQRNATKQ